MRRGQESIKLSTTDVSIVKRLLLLGFTHKRIAALFDVNQGRISEINSGAKYENIQPYKTPSTEAVTYPLLER